MQLGCGTAIPTLCILQEIFSSLPTSDTETHIHLQDYNDSVLKLVTMPNVILAWCKPSFDRASLRKPLTPFFPITTLQIPPRLQMFTASQRSTHPRTSTRSYTSRQSCFTHSKRPYTITQSTYASFPVRGTHSICVTQVDPTTSSSHPKRYITQTVSRVSSASCEMRALRGTSIFVSLPARRFTLVLEAASRNSFGVYGRSLMGGGMGVK